MKDHSFLLFDLQVFVLIFCLYSTTFAVPLDTGLAPVFECKKWEPLTARLSSIDCQGAVDMFKRQMPEINSPYVLIRRGAVRPEQPYLECPHQSYTGGCVLTLNFKGQSEMLDVQPRNLHLAATTLAGWCVGRDAIYDGGRVYMDANQSLWLTVRHPWQEANSTIPTEIQTPALVETA